MEQLRNSLEIAVYCMARDEARAGYSCRSDDFFDRDKAIFEAGYQDGKKRPLCAPLPTLMITVTPGTCLK